MELLTELLEEWREAIAVVRDRVMHGRGNVGDRDALEVAVKEPGEGKDASGMDKENEAFQYDEDFDGSVFDQESLIPSHIPVIKSRNTKLDEGLSVQEEKKGQVDPHLMPSCLDADKRCRPLGYRELAVKEGSIMADLASSELCKGTKLKRLSAAKDLGIDPPKRREVAEASPGDTGAGERAEGNPSRPVDGKSFSANSKLNAAWLQLKKRHLERMNGSVCTRNGTEGLGMQEGDKGRKHSPHIPGPRLSPRKDPKEPEPTRRFNGNNLYKQAIDHQLLRSAGRVPQHIYRAKTKIPQVGEDDAILDPDFVVPDFAKDPAINFKVKMQDHRALERYFSNGYEIDVEQLFPHVKNVSNNSPNKWPAKGNGG
ncbi:hypothetical protein [Encephalitozoon cuniculi GB-M1]|uniref:Uncharacterized protein n=1 Tax=Encephalitozoon cuniculi (strain GB-M1) TaxID=284813 RepID=Q8SUP9_ENCCU|nr:uncharacterized protein ECU08_0990 [Encephalitozoon cuniculi GB-M1]CAD26405.1 hypothetical protein [Encephalitozoon cuniculi GB-M1]